MNLEADSNSQTFGVPMICKLKFLADSPQGIWNSYDKCDIVKLMLNQKGLAPILIILGIIVVLGIAGGAYYLGIKKAPVSPPNLVVAPSSQPADIVQPPCYTKPDPAGGAQLRQTDVKSKFLGNQDFPAEITNICDNELVRMDCIGPYIRQNNGGYAFNSTETAGSVTNTVSLGVTQPDILDNINRLTAKLNGKKPDSISYCAIDSGDLIVEYDINQQTNLSGKTANYALLSSQGGVDILASVPSEKLTNFSCGNPILMTTDHRFYVQCSGGNEQSSSKYIYKIDINGGISTKIFQCSSTGINNRGENNVTCQESLPSTAK